jgi:osmoprotectant transport system permease protein
MTQLANVIQWFADPAHWRGSDGIPQRLIEHVQISAESVAIGALIGLPIGIALGHYGRFGNLAINISNVGRALPSFGLLVIAFQVFGLGTLPILVALVALAVPPMVTNSFFWPREVDPDVKEASRGMLYRELNQLVRVELPLAVPLVMAGIRTSAVQVVATATLAALIAGGGFGRYVIDGFAQQDYTKLFAGAVRVAALAMATELCGTAPAPAWHPTPAGASGRPPHHLQDRISGRIRPDPRFTPTNSQA